MAESDQEYIDRQNQLDPAIREHAIRVRLKQPDVHHLLRDYQADVSYLLNELVMARDIAETFWAEIRDETGIFSKRICPFCGGDKGHRDNCLTLIVQSWSR